MSTFLRNLILIILSLILLGCAAARGTGPNTTLLPRSTSAVVVGKPTAMPTRPTATPGRATLQPTQPPRDGLPRISVDQLPPEARDTLRLIEQGGPFPYDQDGAVFQNRERILPLQKRGYYHEYTVITPGSHDRGTRRIVMGQSGEIYYTDDHYDSFKRVEQ